MIQAVVFDLGGVLFSEGKSVALEKLATAYGYERKLVGAILSSPESVLLRKGLISDADFWQWARQQLPPGYDSRLIQQEWYDGYILDKDVYELIASLQKNTRSLRFREISKAAWLSWKKNMNSATCSISRSILLISI